MNCGSSAVEQIPAKLWSFIIEHIKKKHLNVKEQHLNVLNVKKHLNVKNHFKRERTFKRKKRKKSGVHLLETHTYIVGYGNSKEKPNRICKHC